MFHSYQYLKQPQLANFYASYSNIKTQYPLVSEIIYRTVPRQKSSILYEDTYYKNSTFETTETESLTCDEELDKTLQDEQESDQEFDLTLDKLIYEIDNKKLSQKALKRIERNQTCLSVLIEGDLIEYVKDEFDMDQQNASKWALYMGNSKIMRFDKKSIIYESYWKIAKSNYIFINRDLDKRLLTLPIYETLNKARKAYDNNKKYSKLFSSDKNFCTWCRFDINKSDIDFATDFKNGSNYSSEEAKEFLLNKFLNSLHLAQD